MLKKTACILAGLGLLASATTAFSDSKASLFLVGQVEVIANIFVNPILGTLDTLDVENGETDRLIATVDEETNNTTGYRIDMESVNTANLQHNDGTTNVAYTVKYDGALLAVAPGAVGAPVAVKTVGALTGFTTDVSNVEITVAVGGALLPAGAYTDTLIFTMVAL